MFITIHPQSYATILHQFAAYHKFRHYHFFTHAILVQVIVLIVYLYRDLVPLMIGKDAIDPTSVWAFLNLLAYTSLIAPGIIPRYLRAGSVSAV